MPYNKKLAMQICEELGISWNKNATCATVGGKPIKSDEVTVDSIFTYHPMEGEQEIESKTSE